VRAEGRAEGEKKKAIEVALQLKAMGLAAEDIAKATGLCTEEISQL